MSIQYRFLNTWNLHEPSPRCADSRGHQLQAECFIKSYKIFNPTGPNVGLASRSKPLQEQKSKASKCTSGNEIHWQIGKPRRKMRGLGPLGPLGFSMIQYDFIAPEIVKWTKRAKTLVWFSHGGHHTMRCCLHLRASHLADAKRSICATCNSTSPTDFMSVTCQSLFNLRLNVSNISN